MESAGKVSVLAVSCRRRLNAMPLLVALLIATANAQTIATGCKELFGSECVIKGIDVLRDVQLPQETPRLGVQDVDACRTLCQQHSDCQYFSFFTNLLFPKNAGGTCVLKPGVSPISFPSLFYDKLTSENSSIAVESGRANCAKCDGEGPSQELQLGCSVATPYVCESMAQLAANGTDRISFDPNCTLSEGAPTGCGVGGLKCCRPCRGSVTGGCLENSCYSVDFKYVGSDPMGASLWKGVSLPSQCHTLCLSTPGCAYWTHMASPQLDFLGGSCSLFSTATAKRRLNGPYGLKITSGPADCIKGDNLPNEEAVTTPSPQSGECIKKDVKYTAASIATRWGVGDSLTCQQQCREQLGCKHFSYLGNTWACYLLDRVGAEEAAAPEDRFESGPAYCPGEEKPPVDESKCVEQNKDSVGSDLISFTSVKDALECRKLCKYDPDCAYISFTQGVCYFKYRANVSEKEGVDSGPKLCGDEKDPGLEACFTPDKTYPGQDVGMERNVKNVRQCQKLCANAPACNVFTLRSSEGECYLKSEGTTLVDAPYQISGPKACAPRSCDDNSEECLLWTKLDSSGPSDAAAEAVRRLEDLAMDNNTKAELAAEKIAIKEIKRADSTVPVSTSKPKAGGTQRRMQATKVTAVTASIDSNAVYDDTEAKAVLVRGSQPSAWPIGAGGTAVDFAKPNAWQGIGLKIYVTQQNVTCQIYPIVDAKCSKTVEPVVLKVSAQVVLVSPSQLFSGWPSYNSLLREDEDVFPPYKSANLVGEFVVYNSIVQAEISPANKTMKFARQISGNYPRYWPVDWNSPLRFSEGDANMRFRMINSKPRVDNNTTVKVAFCIWGMGKSLQCSPLVALPAIPSVQKSAASATATVAQKSVGV